LPSWRKKVDEHHRCLMTQAETLKLTAWRHTKHITTCTWKLVQRRFLNFYQTLWRSQTTLVSCVRLVIFQNLSPYYYLKKYF
jgi:hypothetical protein